MSSVSENAAPQPPPPPAPSVFISYASEDRAAVRVLRDTLTAAGLDVWYDEEELTGGDAWDQKIRRQIRDCEYFMPVISATTESRKEGYFRREWRLATDRSLDMADDVLFLIPVTIDGTSENGARVPDKFLTVQWLRAPGGSPTPALHHLIRRLLAGEHHIQARGPTRAPFQRTQAPFAQPPPLSSPPPPEDHAAPSDSPLGVPPFPHIPEGSGFLHGIRYLAESFRWLLNAAWLLFKRLPRWGRVLVTIWLVFTLTSVRCGRNRDNQISIGDGRPSDTQQTVRNAAEQFAQAAREARKNGNAVDLARLGGEFARSFAAGPPDAPGSAMGKRLVMVPFSRLSSEEPAEKFSNAVFASLYGQLTLTHAREVGLLRQPPAANDAALIARAKQIGSSFILAGHLTGEGDQRALTVRLLVAEDGSTKWTESYPVVGAEPSEVADKIADKADDVLPRREPGQRREPPPPRSGN